MRRIIWIHRMTHPCLSISLPPSFERGGHFSVSVCAQKYFFGCRCPLRPTPAFQTIKLDRVCLGSILKGSWHSGDSQKACFQGFQKCTIFAQQTGPRSPLGANFHPPFFCFDGYGLTFNLSGDKKLVKFGPKPVFLHPYHLLAGKWHITSPNSHPWPKLISFYAEVLHLCIETIGWPQMCNSGKGHQFPLFGWGLDGLTKDQFLSHISERGFVQSGTCTAPWGFPFSALRWWHGTLPALFFSYNYL